LEYSGYLGLERGSRGAGVFCGMDRSADDEVVGACFERRARRDDTLLVVAIAIIGRPDARRHDQRARAERGA
jgi:hypothetical protein